MTKNDPEREDWPSQERPLVVEFMRFTLIYEGPLPSSGNGRAKVPFVWNIRKQVAPQLQAVYGTHPVVNGMGGAAGRAAQKEVREIIRREGFEFCALVRHSMGLACELDLKMLVNHTPASVITEAGDLDNRLKTLFDGLRLPKDRHEFVTGDDPNSISRPFLCLLENDAQITKFSVATERWYSATATRAENEVHLSMAVRVTTLFPTFSNPFFAMD